MFSSKPDEESKAKLTESVAATSRRSGTCTSGAESSRDDQTVVRTSNGERDHVKSYMSEARAGGALTRTRQQQCV